MRSHFNYPDYNLSSLEATIIKSKSINQDAFDISEAYDD